MTRERLRVAGLALLVAVVAGCGGGDDADPSTEVPADQPPQAAEPGQAPASGAEPAALPAGVTAAQVQQGQQIFTGPGICFTCHATDGTGSALAPDLTDETWLWVDPSAADALAQITDLVRQGVPEPREHPAPMPPAGGAQLSDEQVEAVAAYVYSLSPRS